MSKADQVAYRKALAARSPEELRSVRASAYPNGVKRCARCSEEKPLCEYREGRQDKTGVIPYCRSCEVARRKALLQRNSARSPSDIAERRAALRPDGTKRCSDCTRTKKLSAFSIARGTSDGLHSICKPCHAKRARHWQKENTKRFAETQAKRVAQLRARTDAEIADAILSRYPDGRECSKCGRFLAANAFSWAREQLGGLRSECRACTSARFREWSRNQKPEWMTEKRRRWIDANREEASKRAIEAHYFKQAVGWDSLVAAMEEKCSYCGEIKPLEVDHMMPHSRGGEADPLNATPACRSCNATKNARTPLEWFVHLLDNREPLPARCAR